MAASMHRKTPDTIATWVAEAVGETIPIEGPSSTVTISASFEGNAGDYQRVRVSASGLEIPPDERFSAEIDDRTIQFMALEDRGDGEYLLRVKVD